MMKHVDYSTNGNSTPSKANDTTKDKASSQKVLAGELFYYGLSSFLLLAGYSFCVGGLSVLFDAAFGWNNPFVIGMIGVTFALALQPVKNWVQRRMDPLTARKRPTTKMITLDYGLNSALDEQALFSNLRNDIQRDLDLTPLHLFTYDASTEFYVSAPDESGKPTTDIRFSSDSSLVQEIQRRGSASLSLDHEQEFPASLQDEKSRLMLINARLIVPLPGREKLAGWLVMGPRDEGTYYLREECIYLEGLCAQAAGVLDRGLIVDDLQRRVREMDVLIRVAQGANSTIVFDDLLELVYAQTNQVIPSKDCRIALVDHEKGSLYYVFYLENDDRLNQFENQALPVEHSLEAEVVHSQRPIYTTDYEHECRKRGFFPALKGIFAWCGVPMNAGAKTIGVMSLGSRDPSITYTVDQRRLLQAIADQASGAIVKARLLAETDRRAREMAILNEIGRNLTSTLEPEKLLDLVLKAAVEVVNCTAGMLFLVDQQTNDLSVNVVNGPLSSGLLGLHPTVSNSLVGKAILEKRALFVNDAANDELWLDNDDIAFRPERLRAIVVPLEVQDRLIGAIEVLNKRDGSLFTTGDLELLTTFTSQAAIAMENARLYTMTDKALAARVEEMAAMQRIDRDLNASLEVERAMRITLEWAMRQSNADAGLIGVMEGEKIRVVAVQGYTDELDRFKKAGEEEICILPTELASLQRALLSGNTQPLRFPLQRKLEEIDDEAGLLANVHSQLAVPIRREREVIGVLFLETVRSEAWREDVRMFLSRLSDHAAIAIANAQLYEEVRAANLAKSKFVSFVAHELKNPMASIKGYTELVISGMAGPVTDMQKSFLSTVRSNVDRMNTIVSDLNDLTKIQIGNLRLEYQAVKIKDVFEDVFRTMKRQIEEKEQVLNVILPENIPDVWADPLRSVQILTNLLSNAQKYTNKGGEITVGAEEYLGGSGMEDVMEFVHIWVQDTGIGIPPEDLPKIFEQYYRTEVSKEVAAGTGLGLNITKSLVEMQGGRIWFDSEYGKGTVFHFTIPVAEAIEEVV